MEPGSERRRRNVAGRFTRSDGLILLAAAALGVVSLATGQVPPNGRYFVFWALFVSAAVLIGVKHILASMRHPLVAFAWCLLGGVLGGALFWFLAWSFVTNHPVRSHGEDYGAMATGLFYIALVLLSPIAGFLTGFPVALAICAWFESNATEAKPSARQSDLE
jgi:biotin transporter BioY